MDLKPDQGSLEVDAEILLEPSAPAETPAAFTFFLNRGLRISAIEIDGAPARWSLDDDLERTPFSPESRRITVPVTSSAAAGPRGTGVSRLHVGYGGRLFSSAGSPARITRWLTELNLYAGWIPIFAGPQGYPWEMKVTAPIDQVIVTNGSDTGASRLKGLTDRATAARGDGGSAAEAGEGEEPAPGTPAAAGPVQEAPATAGSAPGSAPVTTALSGSSAAGDLALLASPQFTRVGPLRASSCSAELIAPELTASIRDTLAQEIAWVCDFYASGSPTGSRGGSNESFPLRVAVVPREDEGYARPPLVVVPAGWFTAGAVDAPESPAAESEWRRRLFHEIAHAFAPLADTHSYDDWINEGLAEQMALQALGERLGEDRAARYVRSYILDLAERAVAGTDMGQRDPGAPSAAAPTVAVRSLPPGPLPSIASTNRSASDASLLYYRKGALIIRMLAALSGPERWAEAMVAARATHPPGGSDRLSTAELLSLLQHATGTSFDWVSRDWIERSGLPEIETRLRIVRQDRSTPRAPEGDQSGAAGDGRAAGSVQTPSGKAGEGKAGNVARPGYVVTGEIVDVSDASRAALPLTLVAIGGEKKEIFDLRLEGGRASVRKEIDFRPASMALDPNRIVPRIDATVREALRLRRLDDRVADLVHDGLEAERQGNLPSALDIYRRLSTLHLGSPFPHYREGRILMRLHDTEGALAAHRRAARLSEKEAGRLARLAKESAAATNPMAVPPAAWIDPDPDLRSWNWIRIGQLEDLRGKRSAAVRAYQRALECPDLRGAHGEARRYLESPYREDALGAAPAR